MSLPPLTDPELAELARQLVIYGLMPLWMAAGFADWLCHRVTHIERTSGVRESVLHAVMLATLGVPTLAVVFLEINALVVAVMIAGYLLHELVVYRDLRFAATRRTIPPAEQMVHSFLEILPLVGGALVVLFNWPVVLSLFGVGERDFSVRFAQPPVPGATLAAIGIAFTVFVAVPYLEELWRCWRVQDGH